MLTEREFEQRYLARAIQKREASREPGISESLRRIRLDDMRFWARLAMLPKLQPFKSVLLTK